MNTFKFWVLGTMNSFSFSFKNMYQTTKIVRVLSSNFLTYGKINTILITCPWNAIDAHRLQVAPMTGFLNTSINYITLV
jgi:hypothetical protein